MRKNAESYEQLGIAEDMFTDEQLIEFMQWQPIMTN
ncbi:hypothetical protein I4B39_004454 [Enterobacter roggenkampii]|nr:hypothetical protein [Enterobacter roggenkampii]MBW9402549.1 hypothetical protein [Leclercia sp. EC_58]